MGIEHIEANIAVLRRTKKYLNGDIKDIVEHQIKQNYELIDNLFDQLNKEYKSIQSYEQGGPHGN